MPEKPFPPIHSSDQLIERAIAIARDGRRKRVAVAGAQDVDVIDAMSQAEADGFLSGILVGDADLIRNYRESDCKLIRNWPKVIR